MVANLLLFVSSSLSVISGYNLYSVQCDSTIDYCECPDKDNNGIVIDVCSFELEIIRLQTFTRYIIDPATKRVIPNNGGSVWYINDTTSELHPFPVPGNTVCSWNGLCTRPLTVDGRTFRSLLTVNGQFPSPTLVVSYNQTVKVKVTNSLQSETASIHWHGLHQKGTNWMDGVEQVTQCGIAPGNIFTYIFQANPMGTFWYHSHVGSNRADGVYGALIIREPNGVFDGGSFIDNPNKYTLLLQDFFKTNYNDYRLMIHSGVYIYNTDRSPDPTYTPKPTSTVAVDNSAVGGIPFWSGLINGLGRHPGLDYTKTRLSVFTVTPSERYRFRVIGSLTRFGLRFSIDEHRLIVIATDGVLIKPITVEYLLIHAGERYDIIVESKSLADLKNKNDFIVRAETVETIASDDNNNPRQPLKGHLAEAILHYNITNKDQSLPTASDYHNIAASSLSIDKTCTLHKPCLALNCFFKAYPPSYNITCIHIHQLELLTPLSANLMPNVTPDEYIMLNFGFEGSAQTSSVNGRKLQLPPTPLTINNDDVSICKGLDNPSYCNNTRDRVLASECICTHVKNISSDVKSIQVVLTGVTPDVSNIAMSAHPIHLHGHYLHIVDIQFGDYAANGQLSDSNNNIDCQNETRVCTAPIWSIGRDYSLNKKGKVKNTSPLKDTIVVPTGGYVVGYLVADNPGYWLLHCHISDHLSEGMSVIINEHIDCINSVPDGMKGQCGDFNWNVDKYYNHMTTSTSEQLNYDEADCNHILLISFIVFIVLLLCVEVVLLLLYCKLYC